MGAVKDAVADIEIGLRTADRFDPQALRDKGRAIAPLAAAIRELAGDDDLAFADTLDGETNALRAASQAVRMVGAMEQLSEAAKALRDRYGARAQDFTDRASRAREAIGQFMAELGEKTLTLPEATLTLAEGRPVMVGDPNPEDLPDSLVTVTRKADRNAIRNALVMGQEVEGCALSNSKPSLRIRTR